jgi:F-type H+-transporting ATPase subunit gamma
MAENLRALKARIKTAQNIAQISKTLEMVSVSKIRRANLFVSTEKPYAQRITALSETVLAALPPEGRDHPYLGKAKSPKKILLAVGPEKGLCGSLAANLARRLQDLDDPDTLVISVGRKMERAAARLGKARLIASFPLGTKLPEYSLVFDIVRLVDQAVRAGEASIVEVLYARFQSFFSQVPSLERILPIAATVAQKDTEIPVFEPGAAVLLDALLPHFLEVRLFDAVIQGYSSEQAARMVAMQNAKTNALDIEESITLLYHKTRQERITSEILDLANQGTKS